MFRLLHHRKTPPSSLGINATGVCQLYLCILGSHNQLDVVRVMEIFLGSRDGELNGILGHFMPTFSAFYY
jgi:hypothetical protein